MHLISNRCACLQANPSCGKDCTAKRSLGLATRRTRRRWTSEARRARRCAPPAQTRRRPRSPALARAQGPGPEPGGSRDGGLGRTGPSRPRYGPRGLLSLAATLERRHRSAHREPLHPCVRWTWWIKPARRETVRPHIAIADAFRQIIICHAIV